MRPIVILLRGVNVGGNNRLPMADLREALTSAGFADVRTYIQTGNIVTGHPSDDPETAAAHVRSVIAGTFSLDVPAIALGAKGLDEVIAANPYPQETDHKRLHAIVLPAGPDEQVLAAVRERAEAVRAKGSRDSVTVIDRVAYLHTPDGFGTSELAKALSTRRSPLADGTARNWATMNRLKDMAAGHVTEP